MNAHGDQNGAIVPVNPHQGNHRTRSLTDRLPHPDKVYAWLERLVSWMDDAFTVPGTNFKFGLDALLGAVPIVGDIATGVVSLSVLYVAVRERIPLRVIVQMLINWGADLVIGAIPIGGDIFDVLFKANRRNFELLKAHRKGARDADVSAGVSTLPRANVSRNGAPVPMSLVLGVIGLLAVVAIVISVAITYGVVMLFVHVARG